jgi:ATP:ADP antiporter, AAA family
MTGGSRLPGAAWFRSLHEVAAGRELTRLLAMMGLFFLVVCAVGILRPIKNALALDGLGATDFYKVYFVSAVVVLFVPLFNRLSDRIAWRTLFGLIALFFALNLVLFRLWYQEGSAGFGLMFYGWYDLFAAALVAQFFMATQVYFDARSAKRAYPVVIAGGSLGATLGGGITGFFAESVGAPNLMLVAALLILIFAGGIPWVLAESSVGTGTAPPGGAQEGTGRRAPAVAADASRGFGPPRSARGRHAEQGTLRELLADRQVLLIAGTVLLTIVVKQLVDYQFNVITKEVFDTRDAISAFQGKFNAATQWLPLVVLAGLRPALRRWGIGSAVLLLPVLMLMTTAALAITFGLIAAVAAKGAETSLRYSAERTGREILYVPLRDSVKLKAKAYIDVAVEKGIGKAASALLIMILLQFLHYRQVAWVSAALAGCWVVLALAVRREYVHTLARSIQGRFASMQGIFTTLVNASTLPVLRGGLRNPSPLPVAFTLELLTQSTTDDVKPLAPELNDLLEHAEPRIRAGVLAELARVPDLLNRTRARALLDDADADVRVAAVRALLAASGNDAPALLNELLRHDASSVRTAALSAILGSDRTPALNEAGRAYVEARWQAAPTGAEAREELALAAGMLHDAAGSHRYLDPFLDDEDLRVRSTALRSAALVGRLDCCARMIRALGQPGTREAARAALALLGQRVVEPLARTLMDETAPAAVRRAIPATLVRIPGQATVDVMLQLVLAPETDQLLDYRTLKALSKLRARHPELTFDPAVVYEVAERECAAADRYRSVQSALLDACPHTPAALLFGALADGWEERREGVFRCLGMLHDPEAVRRAYQAGVRGTPARQANSVEWLEQMLGRERFQRLSAVLEPSRIPAASVSVATLIDDGDAWIALLARALSTDPRKETVPAMELIEKVFLLQQVDLLRGARGAHVALLAAIAEEVSVPADTVLITAGQPPEALYVVTQGAVQLEGAGERLMVGPENAFGTWSLIDEQPSVLEARTTGAARLLRVTRHDFHDLLADHPELAVGLLQGLARRVRSLVA